MATDAQAVSWGESGRVRRLDLVSGLVTDIWTISGGGLKEATRLAVGARSVYGSYVFDPNLIWQIPKGSGTPISHYVGETPSLSVDQTSVLAAYDTCAACNLGREIKIAVDVLDESLQSHRPLCRGPFNSLGPGALDATYVYFGATPNLLRVPKCGGSPESLGAPLDVPTEIAIDSQHVYYAYATGIGRTLK